MTRVSRLSPSAFLLLLLLPPLGCGGAPLGPGSGVDIPSLDDDDTSPTEDDDDSASGGDDDDTSPTEEDDDDSASGGDDDDTTPAGDDDDSGPAERVVVAPDYLNLRSGASSAADVLRALPCGAPLSVLGDESGGWLPVEGEGQEGWVWAGWTLPVDEAPLDPCPGPPAWTGTPPAALVDVLDVPPYVEQSCSSTSWAGWPFEAQHCTYGGGLEVTVADPTPEQVAAWIVDAAQLIPALWGLQTRDSAAFEAGLEVIAWHTLYQSSRIFPLQGEVEESPYVYDFDRGVTVGCSTGCYCRINSTTRQQWCDYADALLGYVNESDCLAEYTTTSWTDAWAEHCLDVHRAAWTSFHHHYRAQAFWANQSVSAAWPDPTTASPWGVVSTLESLF